MCVKYVVFFWLFKNKCDFLNRGCGLICEVLGKVNLFKIEWIFNLGMDLNWGFFLLDFSFNIKIVNLWVKFKVFIFYLKKILLLGFNNCNIVLFIFYVGYF